MRTLYIIPSTYARMANLNLNLKRTIFFLHSKELFSSSEIKTKSKGKKWFAAVMELYVLFVPYDYYYKS